MRISGISIIIIAHDNSNQKRISLFFLLPMIYQMPHFSKQFSLPLEIEET